MKFCVLASGSKGNAIWVEEGACAVLVDCGLSAKEMQRRCALAGLDVKKLAAILLTHEHRDHCSGAGPLSRALNIPVFANKGTQEAVTGFIGKVKWEVFKTSDSFELAFFKIRSVPISHDAADPVSFILESSSGTLGLATDMGVPTGLIKSKLMGLGALILEFNHDYRMLMEGPYPWPLKQRVRSRYGHLANDVAAELAAELYHSDLKHLILAHLSETNNHPDLAIKAAKAALPEACKPKAAAQNKASDVFEL